MKTITLAVIISLGVGALAGCASHKTTTTAAASSAPAAKTPAGTNVLSDERARVSYAIGLSIGNNFKSQNIEVNPDVLLLALKDVQSGGTTLLTQEQMREVLTEFQKSLSAKKQQFLAAVGITNKALEAAFLATNKNNPGVITLPDGLQYIVLTNGSGAAIESNDIVTVNYTGRLLDGSEFDSSAKHGRPAQFGVGNVIRGWTEALLQMNVGSKWTVFIPAELAYREQTRPGITPYSLLIFDVEVVAAEHPKPPAPITSDIVKVPSLEEMKKGAKIEVIKPEDAAKAQAAETNAAAQ
jgi:FKBP-type peptidyl-prolyl cis-trans isomerase FklB